MENVNLGEIFEYLPKSKFKAGDGKERGKYKFFTSSNVQNKFIDEFVYDGEYLIFGTGGKASINYCKGKFATSTDNFVVKVSKDFNAKLIYLYFKNDMEKLERGFKGASIKHISKEYINQLVIPQYDYLKQLDIVKQIDTVQEIIDTREKQIEQLDDLIKSQFVEMFGNDNCLTYKWKEVFNTTTGKLDSNAMVEDGEYPFFTCAKEIFWIDKYAFDCEALLLAGNNAAGIYDVKHYKGKFNAYQRTYVLTLKNDNWKYELFKLQLEEKLELLRHQSKGTNTRYLTMTILNDLEFKIPSIEEQNKFAEFVKQIDKQKFEIQKSLEETQMLQESLMNKYFG